MFDIVRQAQTQDSSCFLELKEIVFEMEHNEAPEQTVFQQNSINTFERLVSTNKFSCL